MLQISWINVPVALKASKYTDCTEIKESQREDLDLFCMTCRTASICSDFKLGGDGCENTVSPFAARKL